MAPGNRILLPALVAVAVLGAALGLVLGGAREASHRGLGLPQRAAPGPQERPVLPADVPGTARSDPDALTSARAPTRRTALEPVQPPEPAVGQIELFAEALRLRVDSNPGARPREGARGTSAPRFGSGRPPGLREMRARPEAGERLDVAAAPLGEFRVLALNRNAPPDSIPVAADGTFELPRAEGPHQLWLHVPEGWMSNESGARTEYGSSPVTLGATRLDGASLSLVVEDLAGRPVRGARVELPAHVPSDEPYLVTDEDGRLCLHSLPPGPLLVHAGSFRHATQSAVFDLASAQWSEGRLQLPVRPAAGDLAGRVQSESGSWRGVVRLQLQDPDGLVFGEQSVELGSDDPDEGRFRFADLPDGEVRLTAHAKLGPEVTPAGLHVRPPDDSIELIVADLAVRDVVFRVHDAETGEPLRGSIGLSIGARSMRAASRGETVVDNVPIREPFTWHVRAAGYELARGGPEALVSAPCAADPGRLGIDVALRRAR